MNHYSVQKSFNKSIVHDVCNKCFQYGHSSNQCTAIIDNTGNVIDIHNMIYTCDICNNEYVTRLSYLKHKHCCENATKIIFSRNVTIEPKRKYAMFECTVFCTMTDPKMHMIIIPNRTMYIYKNVNEQYILSNIKCSTRTQHRESSNMLNEMSYVLFSALTDTNANVFINIMNMFVIFETYDPENKCSNELTVNFTKVTNDNRLDNIISELGIQ